VAQVDSKGDGVDRFVDQHSMGGSNVQYSFQVFSLIAWLCFRHGYALSKGSSRLRPCLELGELGGRGRMLRLDVDLAALA
jgi:hypothetical protein